MKFIANIGNRTARLEESEHLTFNENIQRALNTISGAPCILCKSKATKPVVIVCEGDFAKMVKAPSDGKQRLAFVTVCEQCEANPRYIARIKEAILNRITPERN